MRRKIYLALNILLFLVMTVVCAIALINGQIEASVALFVQIVLGYTFLKFLEMVRLYIIFLEYKINFRRFFCHYLKSELLTLCDIPIGSRILQGYLLGYEIESIGFGIFGVLIDIFYSVTSITIVSFIGQLIAGRILKETLISGCLLICIVLLYMMFIPIYRYFNKFLILHSNSSKTPFLLEVLERIYNGHCNIQCLLKGRSTVLLIISCIIASVQVLFLRILNMDNVANAGYFVMVYGLWVIMIIVRDVGKDKRKYG